MKQLQIELYDGAVIAIYKVNGKTVAEASYYGRGYGALETCLMKLELPFETPYIITDRRTFQIVPTPEDNRAIA